MAGNPPPVAPNPPPPPKGCVAPNMARSLHVKLRKMDRLQHKFQRTLTNSLNKMAAYVGWEVPSLPQGPEHLFRVLSHSLRNDQVKLSNPPQNKQTQVVEYPLLVIPFSQHLSALFFSNPCFRMLEFSGMYPRLMVVSWQLKRCKPLSFVSSTVDTLE